MKFHNYSFGATSAVMTGLAILIGLGTTVNAKANIITALLLIAVVDNVTDSFGIHIHESRTGSERAARKTALMNFLARLIVTAVFILLVVALPILPATIIAVIISFAIIALLSYLVARQRKKNPYPVIFEHLLLAIAVMVVSFLLRDLIAGFTMPLK